MPVLWRVSSGRSSGNDDPDPERHVSWLAKSASTRDFRVPLEDASVHTELWASGNICGKGARINRKRGTKPAEESGSMWLSAW